MPRISLRPRLRKPRKEVNNEEGDMEMAYSVADKHTDSYRNHDGSNVVYGVKKVGTDRKSVGPLLK
jgi:hypothetical protein